MAAAFGAPSYTGRVNITHDSKTRITTDIVVSQYSEVVYATAAKFQMDNLSFKIVVAVSIKS